MTLKELRKVKGFTQTEVSELLNIPLRTLKRYEVDTTLVGSFKYTQIYNNLAKIPAKSQQIEQKSLNIIVVGAGYCAITLPPSPSSSYCNPQFFMIFIA